MTVLRHGVSHVHHSRAFLLRIDAEYELPDE